MPTERVIAVCRRHWTAYWGRVIIAMLLFAYGIRSIPYKNWFDVILSFTIIVIIIICTAISYKKDQIVLTESQITGHVGTIRSKTLVTPISKVQNIGYSNGIMGKIFGYHTIIIDNAGSWKAEFVFKHAADAVHFVKAVQEKIG